MPFSGAAYDPETLDLLTRAFESAWGEIATTDAITDQAAVRTALAIRIMIAASGGERDPDQLKRLGLQAIDGRSADQCEAS